MSAQPVLLTGGRVFTAGMAAPRQADLLLEGGRIAAIGADLEPTGGARVIDSRGSLIVPGFQDAHVHPIVAGVEMLRCDLTAARDVEDCVRIIHDYAAENADAEWILGGGWSMDFFAGGLPSAELLDRIVPDRPVFLNNRDHHGAWVNTRALQLAGIDGTSPDPHDGRIERHSDGSPSGVLHEGAAALVERHVPEVDTAFTVDALVRAQQTLFSFGITGWQDAMVGAVNGLPDTIETYVEALTTGRLRGRVTGAQWWLRDDGLGQTAALRDRRALVAALGSPDRLALDTVKIMVDGIAENYTAAMTQPYLDADGRPTRNSGLSFIDPGRLREIVRELDADGFTVHFHALGDRAVREALDAVEHARRTNGAAGGRHHLAHLQVVHADDVPRFVDVDATANIQALWAAHEKQLDELTLPFLDPELRPRQYPFGDLHRAGARFAAGSDWPVSTPDPLAAIHVAVNRTAPGSSAPPLGERQGLDLATALTAYTAGSARVNGRDRMTGHLRVGASADLAVLDRDPFLGDPLAIAETRVSTTWVDGEPVFTRSEQ
ncbi:amidohydrolase [Leifsonia sp. NPDC077715]|uniref:amidohydrolase n=1 Tax=Leifsonia sp. NPDC077715 TaxID=3155539 RepID=UPI003420F146